jgi:very-short-patch-repair endonuclease
VKARVRVERPGIPRVEVDRAVAELAVAQHGVVARTQLRDLGLGDRAVDHWLQAGRLHRVHRGVYSVGHRLLSQDGRRLAAVSAAGPHAVLSHGSAAELWGLASAGASLEVTVPRDRRDRPGLTLHQGVLSSDERAAVRGIAVTTPGRTLLDLASTVDARTLRRALHEAEVGRLAEAAALEAMVVRHRGRRGARRLRMAIRERDLGGDRTRSELELRFLELVADRRLPAPRANVQVRAGRRLLEADFAWPDQRLIVELDGHATHATRAKFERDRERDRALHAAGWRVIRVTWRQLGEDLEGVVADLRTLLEV